ncbi:dihydrofolate reductase family protein [Actinoplanes sp. LDG1-06]|uniref:Dihydrofolate reductase family protein n=1 Tax=Paractinoplanes ovalisporus TaxID=2810368 RepID=A0ABS2A8E4_9ACTN|nr:dihydrofolate reductase family protein [Actinoplanes ovalisporus]MBM2616113.1 dihydrofolate reductase family protein [Actinoplanes ovalisporus]
MAKLLYSATMSLDGFIAGPDGDMTWMTKLPETGPHEVADGLWQQIGSLLTGARTYHGNDPNAGTDQEGAFSGLWSGPEFVLTHNPPAQATPGSTFVTDLSTAVQAAKEAAGDKYVCVLGADVAAQCLEAGLLDEILVFVAPVLLGDGTPLFRQAGGTFVALDEISSTAGPTPTIWLSVRR